MCILFESKWYASAGAVPSKPVGEAYPLLNTHTHTLPYTSLAHVHRGIITISFNPFICRTKGVLELLEKNYRIHQSLTDTVSSVNPLLPGHRKDQSIPVLCMIMYMCLHYFFQERNSVHKNT